MNKSGFTLIELTVAIVLFSLLALTAVGVVRQTALLSKNGTDAQEAFQAALIAVNFTKAQVEAANAYKVSYLSDGTFRYLDLFTELNPGSEHNYVIRYTRSSKEVAFGGYGAGLGLNELTSIIESFIIEVDTDNEIMYIKATAVFGEERATQAAAVNLYGKDER